MRVAVGAGLGVAFVLTEQQTAVQAQAVDPSSSIQILSRCRSGDPISSSKKR